MRAHLAADTRKAHQVDAFQSFADGLIKHGVRVDASPDDCDFSVWWGETAPPAVKDRPVLYLEAGYFNGASGNYVADRLRFVSTSWGGLHGRASSRHPDAPPDRFVKSGVRFQRWRRPAYAMTALLIGQVPGDRCAPGADTWAQVIQRARGYYENVIIRPHPLVQKPTRSLLHELIDCDVAITWASTAAVETVIAGVPTVVLDRGSVAWPMASHRIEARLCFPDRRQWVYNLAYRQWTHDEFRSGEAWEHIAYGLETDHRAGHRAGHRGDRESAPAHHP